ncbi:MAG: sugar kinase [Candidatus Omnitrophica bacterium]|nr:sugar kinase [Candidatus Omnitrophota bacterium]
MGEILVIGSIAIDCVETPFGANEEQLGGSATYFSLAASLFAEVNLVGVIGKDFPQQHIEPFRKRNVNLSGLEVREGKTFRWKGKYFEDLNKRETLDLQLNVFSAFTPNIPDNLKNPDIVFLANIDPELQADLINQIDSYSLIAADTMDHWIVSKREALLKLLGKIDILILNDEEAKMLAEEQNVLLAGEKLLAGGLKAVIIKKGEHGALLVHKETIFTLPTYPVKSVVDPTGAGDTFAGGCLGYLAQNKSFGLKEMKEAVAYGVVMGSFCVERFGIERLMELGPQDVEGRLRALRDAMSF